jgi:hypothetical protein
MVRIVGCFKFKLKEANVMYDVNQLTQTEARAWLMFYDSEAASYWASLPIQSTDFVRCVRENVRDFGEVI